MLQDKVKVRVGSIAADSEFFISDTAAQFINGTFGWPGITAADMAAGGPGLSAGFAWRARAVLAERIT